MLNALRHVWRHPLNADARFAGLGRFLRWQLATRLLPGAAIAIPFTDRARLLIARGMHGATQNVYCGLNDFADMSFLLHSLGPADLFLDIGANVGAYTVLASAAAKARTYAFEPSPAALDALRSNIALNRIQDLVSVEPYAVGRASGQVSISMEGPSAMHHVDAREEARAGAPVVAMRTVDSYQLPATMMKIDVEGYEAEVLAGARETVMQPRMVAVITENSDDSDRYGEGLASVSDFMQECGFAPVTYDPWHRRLSEKRGYSDNTIYIRNLTEAQRRVREAEPFRILGRSI